MNEEQPDFSYGAVVPKEYVMEMNIHNLEAYALALEKHANSISQLQKNEKLLEHLSHDEANTLTGARNSMGLVSKFLRILKSDLEELNNKGK